jgi:hypothetical protein
MPLPTDWRRTSVGTAAAVVAGLLAMAGAGLAAAGATRRAGSGRRHADEARDAEGVSPGGVDHRVAHPVRRQRPG